MNDVPTCRKCGSGRLNIQRQVMVNGREHCKYICKDCSFKSYIDKKYLDFATETVYSKKYIKEHRESPSLFDYGI